MFGARRWSTACRRARSITQRRLGSTAQRGARSVANRVPWSAVERTADESGFATIMALALIAVLAVCAGAALAIGEIAITRQQAGSAADLAALSVASRLALGDDDSAACEAAAITAATAMAKVVSCGVDGSDALVEVSRRPPDWLVAVTSAAGSPDGAVHARSRAGPPDLAS